MLARIRGFFDNTLDFLAYFACALIIFAFLIVCAEVIMRYLLNHSTSWTLEITEYIVVTVVFLGSAWALKREGHVSLDVVLNLFKTKNRAAINTFNSLLGAIICLVIFWYGVVSTWDHFQRGTIMVEKNLELPTAPFLVVIPIGFFLLFVQFLRRSYKNLRIWRASPEEAERNSE